MTVLTYRVLVDREGEQHQVGSEGVVTAEC